MEIAKFDPPVRIAIGQPRRCRTVSSASDAVTCLKGKEWPAPNGLLTRIAARSLIAANRGYITPKEAREAFIDAALEARVLDISETSH